MITQAFQPAPAEAAAPEPAPVSEHIAPAPRVSVQAFCETVETAAAVQGAGEDRRLDKAHLKIQMGGITAAIEAFKGSPTPNVIVIETEDRGTGILSGLDTLAEECDAGTRVVVISRHNDVVLYRELVRRGVNDYLIAPIGTIDVVRSICGLASSRSSGQRAASAHPRSLTTSPGRSRGNCSSVPWWSISIWASAPPGWTIIRTRRRASPTRCSRPIASTTHSSTGFCRSAPTI
jgi:hypothetical protein